MTPPGGVPCTTRETVGAPQGSVLYTDTEYSPERAVIIRTNVPTHAKVGGVYVFVRMCLTKIKFKVEIRPHLEMSTRFRSFSGRACVVPGAAGCRSRGYDTKSIIRNKSYFLTM